VCVGACAELLGNTLTFINDMRHSSAFVCLRNTRVNVLCYHGLSAKIDAAKNFRKVKYVLRSVNGETRCARTQSAT